jgi:hypothetical protein
LTWYQASAAVVVDCSQVDDFTCFRSASKVTAAGFRVSVFKP